MGSTGDLFRVPLDMLLFPDPVAAGLNPYVLLGLVPLYRNSNEDTVPITVTAEGVYWRVADGRHRAIASMMAGRKHVLALLVP